MAVYTKRAFGLKKYAKEKALMNALELEPTKVYTVKVTV